MAVRALIQPPPLPPQIIKKSIQVSECWKLWIIHCTILGYLYICNKKDDVRIKKEVLSL